MDHYRLFLSSVVLETLQLLELLELEFELFLRELEGIFVILNVLRVKAPKMFEETLEEPLLEVI